MTEDENTSPDEEQPDIVLSPAGLAEVDQLNAAARDAEAFCDAMAERMEAANDRMECAMMEENWDYEPKGDADDGPPSS